MQSTTNYSMNLVEGTDLVNIPVQLNPNFQTIDQEMFANKQATIGTATEVVTGTVHAVVRANVDADVFRFTATGAWTAGDTMTLDGSAVTVHLADGTAPTTGAYIIGAEVVAVVNGTLVTLLTSNGAIDPGVISFNTRTGAVVPAASDYDASMIDYDNTSSGLTATDLQGAIDEIGTDSGWIVVNTNLKYRKIGVVVYVEMTTVSGSTWTLIGNIPSGFRPDLDLISCNYYDSINNSLVRIKPDGEVSCNSTTGGLNYAISYISA